MDPKTFFQAYLAGPFLIVLYFMWKVYSWFVIPEHRPLFIRTKDIDIYTGMRENQLEISGADVPEDRRRASIAELQAEQRKKGPKDYIMGVVGNIF